LWSLAVIHTKALATESRDSNLLIPKHTIGHCPETDQTTSYSDNKLIPWDPFQYSVCSHYPTKTFLIFAIMLVLTIAEVSHIILGFSAFC
jgi:hypothetical protein